MFVRTTTYNESGVRMRYYHKPVGRNCRSDLALGYLDTILAFRAFIGDVKVRGVIPPRQKMKWSIKKIASYKATYFARTGYLTQNVATSGL